MDRRNEPLPDTDRSDEGSYERALALSGNDDRLAWWREARLGVFAHWGLSAIPAGWWEGQRIEGLSEWIQQRARVPLARYAALARSFSPTSFNAEEWVGLAAEAGAAYFVFTAKHHDGFAMYHSAADRYNVADATDWGRDPLHDIAEACRAHGIQLGMYYSHMIDWAHPDAAGPSANDWDFDPKQADFERYWSGKAIPQLTELMTQYGEVGVVWFDMPQGLSTTHAREATDLVRRLQPSAVINSRVGLGGDYDIRSMDDNYLDTIVPPRDWETAATTNESWGFSKDPGRWKTIPSLRESVATIASRGGNLLLNVGPDSEGKIPEEAERQLRGLGAWMGHAGHGIRGTERSPFPSGFDWGVVTRRDRTLYLHVTDPGRREIVLPGLTGVLPTSSLKSTASLRVSVPESEVQPRLVEVALPDGVEVGDRITQPPGEALRLEVPSASAPQQGVLEWEMNISDPGDYRVVLLSKQTFKHSEPTWWGAGLRGRVETSATKAIDFSLSDDGHEDSAVLFYWQIVRSHIADICIDAPGPFCLRILDLPVVDSKWDQSGVNLVAVRLEPVAATTPATP